MQVVTRHQNWDMDPRARIADYALLIAQSPCGFHWSLWSRITPRYRTLCSRGIKVSPNCSGSLLVLFQFWVKYVYCVLTLLRMEADLAPHCRAASPTGSRMSCTCLTVCLVVK